MTHTHYCEPIPAKPDRGRFLQRQSWTLCGRYILREHESQTPTCPICAAELEKRLNDVRVVDEVFGKGPP